MAKANSFLLSTLFVGLAGLGASCSADSSSGGAVQGSEGHDCFPNVTCNMGLTCLSKLCVRLPEAGTGRGAGGRTGGGAGGSRTGLGGAGTGGSSVHSDASGGSGGAGGGASSEPVDASDADSQPGDTGVTSCSCFQHGQWSVSNDVPCLFGNGEGTWSAATSSIVQGQFPSCPSDYSQAPPQPWSTDTLTTDCKGHYKLCLTLKAGDALAPKGSDCVLAHVCSEADYSRSNVAQAFPNLPGWLSTDAACTTQFNQSGGYAESSVSGTGTPCGAVPTRVFNIQQYCATACSDPNPPATCSTCTYFGADGKF